MRESESKADPFGRILSRALAAKIPEKLETAIVRNQISSLQTEYRIAGKGIDKIGGAIQIDQIEVMGRAAAKSSNNGTISY